MKTLNSSTMEYTTRKDAFCDPQNRSPKDMFHVSELLRPSAGTATTLIPP